MSRELVSDADSLELPSFDEQLRALEALRRHPEDAATARRVVELTIEDPRGARAAREAIAPEPEERLLRAPPITPSVEPGSLSELIETVRVAAAQRKRLKAVGAGYAFSNILDTDGLTVGLSRNLNRILSVDASVLRDPGAASSLVSFEAGATVEQLNTHLWNHGQALLNQPGYEKLSYVGAMSAGAHGSGIRLGPLCDALRSLHLVTVDRGGRVVQRRIEPAAGITDRARFGVTHRDVELIQDDAVFHACAVGVGCLGIVYAATVEVGPRFFLRERRTMRRWAEVRGEIDGALRDPAIHSVHVWLNPYAVGGEIHCVLTLYEPEEGLRRGQRAFGVTWYGVGDLGPLVRWVVVNLPISTAAILNASLSATVPAGEPPVLPCTEALNFGAPNQIDVDAGACGVDAARTVEAAEALMDLFQRRARDRGAYVTSPIGLRFVKASTALLSPQFGRDTCMIEVPLLKGTPLSLETLDAFQDVLFARFQGRPHWGQVNRRMNEERLSALYPELRAFLSAYGELNALGLFDDAFTEQLGLPALAGRLCSPKAAE